ncbi:MAG: hypothetical protein LW834_05900 [Cyanobium sp. 49614_E6]|nr:hypothetical protein [Cyanobium sp. 49614_E6]
MTQDRYEAEAAEFFRRNPHVYESFKMLAYKAVNAISSDADVADYALNNNYVRWAAKRLEAEGELPGGFFQFRTRRDQGVDSPDLPE